MQEGPVGEWVELGYMAERTGFDEGTLRRLIDAGDLPVMQVAGPVRTSHKIPRSLVDQAYAVVMAGGQVEIRAFAREWAARNTAEAETFVAGVEAGRLVKVEEFGRQWAERNASPEAVA